MRQVSCRNCGNRVLVEKYSEAHTSVQWLEESQEVCPELGRVNSRAKIGRAHV